MQSDRNLRRALLMMECAKMQSTPNPSGSIDASVEVRPDWQVYIDRLSREILADQSPSMLIKARDMLYELLTNCIPADVILESLTVSLMKSLDDTLKHELCHWAAHYNHRLSMGSKEIFHLEAFVAKSVTILPLSMVCVSNVCCFCAVGSWRCTRSGS